MLGIGFTEMLVIAGIALVVIGPEKFPDFAKLVIRTIRDLRGYVDEMKTEVSKELKPIKKEMDQFSKIDPEKYIDSLTKETPDTPANPALHEEDRKVMEAAGAYDEDPYGWEDSEPGGYDQPPGDSKAPEDTVGYGEDTGGDKDAPDAGPADTGATEAGEAEVDEPQAPSDGDDAATSLAEGDETPAESLDLDPAFELPRNTVQSGGDNEPDVWTGRKS